MHGVGVGKQEPLALSCFGASDDGIILAGPTCGERAGFDDLDARVRKRRGDFAGAVSGMIVDHNDFEGHACLRGVALQQKGFETLAETDFFIASRNDDRHGGLAGC